MTFQVQKNKVPLQSVWIQSLKPCHSYYCYSIMILFLLCWISDSESTLENRSLQSKKMTFSHKILDLVFQRSELNSAKVLVAFLSNILNRD